MDIVLRHTGFANVAERVGLVIVSALGFIVVGKRLVPPPWFWCLVAALTAINAVLAAVIVPRTEFLPFITWLVLLSEILFVLWLDSRVRRGTHELK